MKNGLNFSIKSLIKMIGLTKSYKLYFIIKINEIEENILKLKDIDIYKLNELIHIFICISFAIISTK